MQDFIKCLLSLTVGGSVLAVCLLLLGRVKKLPKSFFYYAWLLVLLRLALPLPGNLNLSVPKPMEPLVISDPNPVWIESNEWNQELLDAVETYPVRPYLDMKETPDPIRPVYMSPTYMDPWTALTILWGLGFGFCLVRDLGGYGRFRRALNRNLKPALASDLELYTPLAGHHGPRLLRSPGLDTPMLMGIVRPVLLLPDRDYAPEILDCIFRHELTHYRRGDIVLKWLAMPILAAHWFNPLTIFIRREFHQSCELSCDERILKTMDHDQRKCYGETLLVLAARSAPARTALSTSFCAEKRNLKERLVHIMNFGPKSKWVLGITALLLAGVIAACLALGPAREETLEEPQETQAAEAVQNTDSYMSLGFAADMPQVYSGEALHAKVRLKASKDNWGDGIGLLLLLDGRPQPYKTAEDATLRYMHTFTKPLKGACEAELIFEPVAGHEGETVILSVFTVKNPRRYTFDPTVPFDHSDAALSAGGRVILLTEPENILPQPDTPAMGASAEIDFQNSTADSYDFTFTPGVRLGDTQKFRASATGPAGAEMCYVIYFNNEPVFCYPFFAIEGKQRAVIDTNLSFRNFQGDGMIYAVLYGKNPNAPGDNFIDISDTYYLTVPQADRVSQGADVQTNVVVVSTVDEFLAAIGPDTLIAMEPGVYDLTTASDYGQSSGPSPYYHWQPYSDGYGLTIYDVDNLFITSQRTDSCEIITQSKRAPVLAFVKCNTIDINCVNAGYGEEAAGATASVLRADGCRDFFVQNCEFYGGGQGVQVKDCEMLTVKYSQIRDCSSGAATVTSCVDTFLYDNQITGIGKGPADDATNRTAPAALFQVYTSSSSAVLDCHMEDSVAKTLLITDESQQIYFMGNTGTDLDIRGGVFASCNGAPTVDGCQLKFREDTAWMEKEYGGIDYVYNIQGDKLNSEDLDEMKYRAWSLPLSFMKSEYADYYQENQRERDRLNAVLEAAGY